MTIKSKQKRQALIENAKTDPIAAAQLAELRAKERAQTKRRNQKHKERIVTNTTYAAKEIAKARSKVHSEERKVHLRKLMEQAETDPKAAEKPAEHRTSFARKQTEWKRQKTAKVPKDTAS